MVVNEMVPSTDEDQVDKSEPSAKGVPDEKSDGSHVKAIISIETDLSHVLFSQRLQPTNNLQISWTYLESIISTSRYLKSYRKYRTIKNF